MDWLQGVWFDVRIGWKAYLAVGLTLAGIIGLYLRSDAFLTAKGEAKEATIVSFYTSPRDQKWEPGMVVVEARSKDGMTGRRSVPRALVKGCEVGDPVSAVRVGNRLRIEPWPCTSARP